MNTVMLTRTKAFALRIVLLVEALPSTRTAEVLGRQLLRCGTGVGSNYRASQRAKSRADFINKLKIAEEEADESVYWLELLAESGAVSASRLVGITKEANEITAIIVASLRTARRNQ